MRVLLVDDHPVVLHAVGNLLASEGFDVVGKVTNGFCAVSETLRLKPELLILDIDIPKLDGLGVLKRLDSFPSRPKVLVLTGTKSKQIAALCLKAGAAGYISKEGGMEELLQACKALRSGLSWFRLDTIDSVRENDFLTKESELINLLSPREVNVLRCLARGYKNTKIAEEMDISHKTVSTYKTRLQQKLGINNLIALADFAKRNGLN